MKEIEYRGLYHNRIWLHGDVMEHDGRYFIRNKREVREPKPMAVKATFAKQKRIKEPVLGFVEVARETVCMFTGRKDKHGARLYTGDLVQHEGTEFEIVWDDSLLAIMMIGQIEGEILPGRYELPPNDQLLKVGTIFDHIIKTAQEIRTS